MNEVRFTPEEIREGYREWAWSGEKPCPIGEMHPTLAAELAWQAAIKWMLTDQPPVSSNTHNPNPVSSASAELMWLAEAACAYLDSVSLKKHRGSHPFEALLEAADSYKARHGDDPVARMKSTQNPNPEPTVEEERVRFEAWRQSENEAGDLSRNPNGEYTNHFVEFAWRGWLAAKGYKR